MSYLSFFKFDRSHLPTRTFKKWVLFCPFPAVYKTDRKGNDLFNLVPRVPHFPALSLQEREKMREPTNEVVTCSPRKRFSGISKLRFVIDAINYSLHLVCGSCPASGWCGAFHNGN